MNGQLKNKYGDCFIRGNNGELSNWSLCKADHFTSSDFIHITAELQSSSNSAVSVQSDTDKS